MKIGIEDIFVFAGVLLLGIGSGLVWESFGSGVAAVGLMLFYLGIRYAERPGGPGTPD